MVENHKFPTPYPVQFTGSPIAHWLLARLGWVVKFEGLPALQGVVVVYPHTSNWDFVVLMLVKWAIGVPVRFWGKDSLFRIPLFGLWLRWLGGVPVDRKASNGVVSQAVNLMSECRLQERYFWLGVAPEGTRKKRLGWRSGFYQTAWLAGVPLGLVRLDYKRREVVALDFITLSGDRAKDFARIAAVYKGVRGLRPRNASPIRPLDRAGLLTETVER
jgi:1-acyl-sn-glycerol-3-phosphate acyltransferase